MTERLQEITSGRAEPKKRGLSAWFAGRARRREYWAWVVPCLLLTAVMSIGGSVAAGALASVPILFAMIRRLHDLGHSGWWAPVINVASNAAYGIGILVAGGFGALVGSLIYIAVLIVMGSLKGEQGANEYGPPPGGKVAPDSAT